jgi:hypothetical protein
MAAFTVRKLARGEIQVGNDTFQKNPTSSSIFKAMHTGPLAEVP